MLAAYGPERNPTVHPPYHVRVVDPKRFWGKKFKIVVISFCNYIGNDIFFPAVYGFTYFLSFHPPTPLSRMFSRHGLGGAWRGVRWPPSNFRVNQLPARPSRVFVGDHVQLCRGDGIFSCNAFSARSGTLLRRVRRMGRRRGGGVRTRRENGGRKKENKRVTGVSPPRVNVYSNVYSVG